MALSALDENDSHWNDGLKITRRTSHRRRQSGRRVGAGTARNEIELALDTRADARSVEASSTGLTGFIAGLRRARSWRVPPNWSALDWHEELRAVALAAAWQAEQDHDPSRGVPLAGFICCRVKAQALTRYRQEWRYALRVTTAETDTLAETETIETFAGGEPSPSQAGAAFEVVGLALALLSEPERWLLEQLFWQHRTEASIAAELHISQPAVNKRKRMALLHLRALL